MKIAYFDCGSGIAGDMILGALVDLGVRLSTIESGLKKLKVDGYRLKSRVVKRGMISGVKVDVELMGSTKKSNKSDYHHHHRTFSDIKKIIESSRLPSTIVDKSIKVFTRIARAEARVHRTRMDRVHFHEVGAIDSIVDIVGGIIGLESLDVDAIVSSPLNTGEGTVDCEHGTLPVPAPATLRILEGVPCYSNGVKKELTTPTGASMIACLAQSYGSLPEMKINGSGHGAGTHILKEFPNLLRIILGEQTTPHEKMLVLETSIDDMNPEYYEHVMETLFASGAVDVILTPVLMKKSRPAQTLSVLLYPADREAITRVLFAETSTFGLRFYEVERRVLDRKIQSVKTRWGTVAVKIGQWQGETLQWAPEYEDCKKIARKSKVPLKRVFDEAIQLAQQRWK